MSKFVEQSTKIFEAAGLFEPQTRAVKLRYSLEAIDRSQSQGASLEQIMKTLEASGLVFPSLVAFKMALTRARKAGPMGSSKVPEAPSLPSSPAVEVGATKSGNENMEPVSGVPIFRPKRVEFGTNRIPTMEDFV